MYRPELQSKVALWRQRAAEGTMSADDYREAILALREGRIAASAASKPKKAKAAKSAAPTGDDLLDQLEGL